MLSPLNSTWRTPAAILISILCVCSSIGQAQTYRRPTGRYQLGALTAERQRLTASNAGPSNEFGWSVAISGDRLAVCAIQVPSADEPDATNAGEVVIFGRTAGDWSELQVIPNPFPERNDYFGQVLAMSDDHLFVGVPEDMNRAGSVYIYTREGETFVQEDILVLDDPPEAARFGISLATDGETLVVGASRAGENHEGVVYVFMFDGSSWHFDQTLIPADGESDNGFGAASALSGDLLVVGAPGDPNGAVWGAGSAYVFQRVGEEWVEHQKLTAADAEWYDGFGIPVAISGGTAMISSGGKNHPENQYAGAVYVFTETSGNWVQDVQLFAPDPTYGTGWGWALALSGDTAMIGFPNTVHSDPPYAGAVDVLTRTDDVWSPVQRLVSEYPVSSGSFGYSLAQSGSDLLIGAPLEDAPGPVWDAGAAYVMTMPNLKGAHTAQDDGSRSPW